MKAHTLLLIINDVIALLRSRGILTATGFDQTKVDSIAEDAELAQAIAAVLEQHGVNVPDRVEQVLAILPLIAGFIK